MAGAGRRVFQPGEVLTASNVMSYLQDQAVMSFAGTAARGSAIGTAVADGMVSYLQDTNDVQVYKTVGTAVAGWESNTVQQSPNYVINGGFDIWQRGTSGAGFVSSGGFVADRWQGARTSAVAGQTMSRQDSGLAGARYCLRLQRDSGNTGIQALRISQSIETSNSYELAGKTVTLSFYARTGANFSGSSISAIIYSGTGTDQNQLITGFTGSATVASSDSLAVSSAWTRFSISGVVSSSATQLAVMLSYTPSGTAGAADYFEVAGVQVEQGSTATPFRRNANSIQGELAACQRYYQAQSNLTNYGTTSGAGVLTRVSNVYLPVQMRSAITSSDVTVTWNAAGTISVAGSGTSSFGCYIAIGNTTSEVYLASYAVSKEL